MGLNPNTAYFHIIAHQPSQAEITGEVLTDDSVHRLLYHSASYPPGKANRVAAYQW